MRLPRPLLAYGTALALASVVGAPVRAQDVDREIVGIERDTEDLLARRMAENPERGPRYVEGRIADAELYFRLHDYLRASIVLTEIVERHDSHPAAGDARLLLADSLFASGDFLGAREHYRAILDRSSDPRFMPYAERALGRLVEIGVTTRNFEGIERYFGRIASDPSSEAASTTNYFRGKYEFGRAVPEAVVESGRAAGSTLDPARLEQARRYFSAVADGTRMAPQARYFAGVVHVLRGELTQALAVFEQVGSGGETPEHRRVADLASLAIGRVRNALGLHREALDAYAQVPRTSAEFPRALYESAWVHLALEDTDAAARTLEVLSLAAPESPLIPEAQLVRANLLLRAGRLDEADGVFREAAEAMRPVAGELDGIARAHADLPAYFAGVVRSQRETFSVDALLPESARRYTDSDPAFERAARTLEELTLTRQLVRETTELVERLEVALSSRTVVNAFSDTREQARAIEVLRNRIAFAQNVLLEREARVGRTAAPGLDAARARRRALAAELEAAPRTPEDATERDEARLSRVRVLGRQLREIEVEIVGLEARIVATQHYLERAPMADAAGQTAVRREVELHRASLTTYREAADALRRELEVARLDIGVGDDAYERDRQLRAEFARAAGEERRLAGSVGGPLEAQFRRLAMLEGRVAAREREIGAAIAARTERIRGVVAEERQNLVRYRELLALLELQAEVVVGGVSMETFERVRTRFRDYVLRAEVGHVDVTWADREGHRTRFEELSQARALELGEIDAEFADILGGAPVGGDP